TKFKRVRNVDGDVVADYIFAYNTTKDTVTATFTFTGITPASMTVYGENRTLPTFSDNFGPEQAHVYVIRYQWFRARAPVVSSGARTPRHACARGQSGDKPGAGALPALHVSAR